MVTISKQYTFDAAHRLPNHNGKCARLHGHTYQVTVRATGRIRMDDASASDYGMVMDYGDIDAVVKPLIESLDHCMLNSIADSVEDDIKLLAVPTAERIALFLVRKLYLAFSSDPRAKKIGWSVSVNETPKTSATVDIYDVFDYEAESPEITTD